MESRKAAMMAWMFGGMVLAGMTGCSGDDDATTVPDDGVKVRRMTITETEDAAARLVLTRASLTEDGGLAASWTAGDALTYCNLSRTVEGGSTPYSGGLTAASTARASQFTGDVACGRGDYLAVVYPATTFSTNTAFTLSLAGQDGTLTGLATRFHYVFGKAQVTAVTDQTATATMGQMKSLLAVCKFAFVDKATGNDIPVKTLTIAYGGSGSETGTYPQSATVVIGVSTAQSDVHATAVASNSALTVTPPSEGQGEALYVALLPTTNERTFRFTVTDGSGNTYKGTAKAALAEGEYVEATGLRLTKQESKE